MTYPLEMLAAAGLTIAQMGAMVGKSENTIGRYEAGARTVSVQTLDACFRLVGHELRAVPVDTPPESQPTPRELAARLRMIAGHLETRGSVDELQS